MPNEFKFENNEALATALAENVATSLRDALAARHHASLVVSGGRSPAPFLAALSRQALDWSSIWVTLADERWVDDSHVDSNEAMVRKYLLQNRAVNARIVGLKNTASTPLQGEAECDRSVAAIPRPFDVVILGMGDDGHTASLFPQAPQLAKALDVSSDKLCIAVDPVTAAHPRISLTLRALLMCRRVVIAFNGASKYDVYRTAMQPGPVEALPIRSILRQNQVPVDVFWSQ